jgi:hypothetical protein
MVTYAGVFMAACSAGCGSLGRELVDGFGRSLAGLSESNLSEAMSARLYFCTEEPTSKLISLSVPPMNLPLIRLPFFSSKESAHAREAPSHRAMTILHFSFNFTFDFSSAAFLFLLLVQVDWDRWDLTTVRTWFYLFPVSFSGSTAACSGRDDFFKVTATLCARLWVARKLPPMNRTLPSTTCSWTTRPSRVTN